MHTTPGVGLGPCQTSMSEHFFENTRFFYRQHFYKERQAEIGKKVKKMLSNTMRLNFCYLKIIHILHLPYHRKIIGHIKNKQKNKFLCIHEIIRFNHNENEDENEK